MITDWTEENQEGTFCGFDKQALVDLIWLCPSTGPTAPQCYLSSLKSGLFRQLCKNKRRADENMVGILTDQRRNLQLCTNRCRPVRLPGLLPAGCSCSSQLVDLSGHSDHHLFTTSIFQRGHENDTRRALYNLHIISFICSHTQNSGVPA